MFSASAATRLIAILTLVLVTHASFGRAIPAGNAFTYQGQLKQGGNLVNATADFQFTLFDAATDGLGLLPMMPADGVVVEDGLFTVELDFGSTAFGSDARWLQIAVRSPAGSGTFTPLSPRQRIQPTPVTQFALNANGAGVTNINANNITAGTMNAGRMPTGGAWSLSSALNLDSNSFVIDAANNRVGIGTATPNVPLEVAGVARFTGLGQFSIGSDSGQVRIDAGGANFQLFRFLSAVNTYTGLRARQASIGGNFGDIDSPSGGLIVQGNVGIGTSTPLLALDVAGSSGPAASSGNGANGILRVKPSATTAILDIGGTGSPAHAWLQSRDSANYNVDYNLALNPNGGNVGVGTISPLTNLHVTGPGAIALPAAAVDFNERVIIQGSVPVLGLYGTSGVNTGIALKHIDAGALADTWGMIRDLQIVGVPSLHFTYGPDKDPRANPVMMKVDNSGHLTIGGDLTADTARFIGPGGFTIGSVAGTSRIARAPNASGNFVFLTGFDTYAGLQFESAAIGGTYGDVTAPADGMIVEGIVGIGKNNPTFRLDLPNTATSAGGQGRANAWTTYSSIRWKENISSIGHALDKVMAMRGVYFDWKAENGGGHDIGFIAEEVGAVAPELVTWDHDGQFAESLKYDRITAITVNAIQELRAEKDAEIAELKSRVESLESMVQQLLANQTGGRP